MFYSIPETKMLQAARNSLIPGSRPRGMFLELMIFLLVISVCSIPQNALISIALSALMLADPAYMEMINEMSSAEQLDFNAMYEYLDALTATHLDEIMLLSIATSGIFILGAIIYCKVFEKRKPYTLGFIGRDVIGEYLMGIGLGVVMISLPAIACHVTGCVRITLADNLSPVMIVLFFLAFVLQGMGEEAIFRGYLLTSLCRRNGPWMAIIMSALMFSAFHVPNQGFNFISFINITLFGIFAGVFMLKRGSIWAIGAIHTAWNFAQGNIFGFSVSGNPKLPAVFEAVDAGFGSILSGGEFGLEGGLGATVVLLTALLLVLLMPGKSSELADTPLQSADM